jgi:rod shape-determining protein MreD
MNRPLKLFILGYVCIVVQSSLQFYLPYQWAAPQFLFLLVVFLGMHPVTALSAFVAFAGGIGMDILSAGVIGPWAGAFLVAYSLTAFLTQWGNPRSLIIRSLFVVLATGAATGVYHLMRLVGPGSWPSTGMFLEEIFKTMVASFIAFPVFKAVLSGHRGQMIAREMRGSIRSSYA